MHSMCVCLVLIYIDLVHGLKCFECTFSESSCSNPIQNNASIIDCSLSVFTVRPEDVEARLRGLKQDDRNFQCLTTIERRSENVLYTRRCALKSENNICEAILSNNTETKLEMCLLCDKDLCNSSKLSSSPSSGLIYLFLLCFLFIYK